MEYQPCLRWSPFFGARTHGVCSKDGGTAVEPDGELVIEGGFHAGFGSYGTQKGDSTPTISGKDLNGLRFSNIFIEKRGSFYLQIVAISRFLFFIDSNLATPFFQNFITIILPGAAI